MSHPVSSRTPPARLREILFGLRDAVRFFSDRNVLECIGVLEGLKDVVRIPVTSHEWRLLRDACEELGLAIGHANFKLAVTRTTRVGDTFTTNVQWDDPRGREFLAYIARSPEVVKLARETEVGSGSDVTMGRLYQYPECCIQAYGEIVRGLPWVEALVRCARGSRQERGANKLAYLFDGCSLFPDYFPCSLSCGETVALSKRYFSLLRANDLNDFAQSLWERMGRPVLVGPGFAYQFVASRFEPGGILFDAPGVRRYAWAEDQPDPLVGSGFLAVEEDGPWLRAVLAGQTLGTLFVFHDRDPSW